MVGIANRTTTILYFSLGKNNNEARSVARRWAFATHKILAVSDTCPEWPTLSAKLRRECPSHNSHTDTEHSSARRATVTPPHCGSIVKSCCWGCTKKHWIIIVAALVRHSQRRVVDAICQVEIFSYNNSGPNHLRLWKPPTLQEHTSSTVVAAGECELHWVGPWCVANQWLASSSVDRTRRHSQMTSTSIWLLSDDGWC